MTCNTHRLAPKSRAVGWLTIFLIGCAPGDDITHVESEPTVAPPTEERPTTDGPTAHVDLRAPKRPLAPRTARVDLSPVARIPGAEHASKSVAPGTVDKTFGKAGIVRTGEIVDRVAVLPDSSALLLKFGGAGAGAASGLHFGLSRISATGVVDTAFGDHGDAVFLAPYREFRRGMAIAVHADGRPVVAITGAPYGSSWQEEGVLTQLSASGRADPTFASGGSVTFKDMYQNGARDVAVRPSGAVVALLDCDNGRGTGTYELAGLTAAGARDGTFGTLGLVQSRAFQTYEDSPIALQGLALRIFPDGKLLVVAMQKFGSSSTIVVDRYTTDGAPDSTFGVDGRVIVRDPEIEVNAAAIHPSGEVSLVGSVSLGGLALTRLAASGAIDLGFGANGVARPIPPGPWQRGEAQSVAVEESGDVLVGGAIWPDGGPLSSAAIVRLSPTGLVDTTFGADGWVGATAAPLSGSVRILALRPDHRVLVGTGSAELTAYGR